MSNAFRFYKYRKPKCLKRNYTTNSKKYIIRTLYYSIHNIYGRYHAIVSNTFCREKQQKAIDDANDRQREPKLQKKKNKRNSNKRSSMRYDKEY